ncbi:MAG TPA: hypothetical protein VF720_15080 [Candidatus Eisenbacteria bacterium]
MNSHCRTILLLGSLALLLPTRAGAAPYVNDQVAMSEATKRAQAAALEDFRARQVVYLQGYVERDGTISRWEVRESFAPPAATDSLLVMAKRGDFPWSDAQPRRSGDPGWIIVPITLNTSVPADGPRMSAGQVNQLEALLPGWLSRLRRSDPGLALTQFRHVASHPLNAPSGLFPMNEHFGEPAAARPASLESAPTNSPAFHRLKWEKGLLTRSPDGRYIFDMGADLEVMEDGELGGDCGGGWTIYDGATHQRLWGTTPGNYSHARSGAWAGSDLLALYGDVRLSHPTNPNLDCYVPAIWIFDFTAKTYTMWEGPAGPQWVFAGRPD